MLVINDNVWNVHVEIIVWQYYNVHQLVHTNDNDRCVYEDNDFLVNVLHPKQLLFKKTDISDIRSENFTFQ